MFLTLCKSSPQVFWNGSFHNQFLCQLTSKAMSQPLLLPPASTFCLLPEQPHSLDGRIRTWHVFSNTLLVFPETFSCADSTMVVCYNSRTAPSKTEIITILLSSGSHLIFYHHSKNTGVFGGVCVQSLYYKSAVTHKRQQEMKCRDNICQEPEHICFVSLFWQE